jgi:hypothetical protein
VNPNKIIIDLPESDGFHTTNDRALAEITCNRVQAYLSEPGGIPGCTVKVDPCAESLPALRQVYDRLLDMHMDALLTYGPGVAQGLALAITTIYNMAPEVQPEPSTSSKEAPDVQ